MAARRGPVATLVLTLLKAYKLLISPLFTGCCRFQPSCADYMAEAVTRHGAGRGLWLGTRRLCRCHPFGGHGLDPVPTTK
jgi:putative membrane protein insertion efficiency factor